MYKINKRIPLLNPIFLFEIRIINVRTVSASKTNIILRLKFCMFCVKKIGL